jgi:hypothetical protein
MEVSGDKENTRISLDISPLFFHILSKLVLALVLTYEETVQAVAVKGDVLLPKPFLDPSPHTAQPDSAPLDCHVHGKLKKHLRGR